MAIIIPNPIVIPEQRIVIPEKRADKVWILSMNVDAINGVSTPTVVRISVAPFVSSTGEVLTEQRREIYVEDLFAACANNSTLAQAVGAIYNAVEELCKQQKFFGLKPDPIPVSIQTHPYAANVYEFDTVTFNVSAIGDDLTYQWQKDGVDIPGAINSTFTISQVQLTDDADYSVIVSNSVNYIISNVASLTVTEIIAPKIITQPTNVNANIGDAVSLTVEATGTNLQYQWQKDGMIMEGFTSSAINLSGIIPPGYGIQLHHAGAYTVIVSNLKGTVSSDIAIVSVN